MEDEKATLSLIPLFSEPSLIPYTIGYHIFETEI